MKVTGPEKHLTVDMVGPGSHSRSTSTFTDVHRVRLARVYEMFLHRKKKPTETHDLQTPSSSTFDDDLLGDTSRSLMIQSRGPMVVDFLGKTASFENEVLVRSVDDKGDQLQCELLTIFFENKAGEMSAGLSAPSKSKSDFSVNRLMAEGKGDRQVVLTATSRQAQAVAERMDYDPD